MGRNVLRLPTKVPTLSMTSLQIAMSAGVPCTALRDRILTHPTLVEDLIPLYSSPASMPEPPDEGLSSFRRHALHERRGNQSGLTSSATDPAARHLISGRGKPDSPGKVGKRSSYQFTLGGTTK
jgi:hypothetical protein